MLTNNKNKERVLLKNGNALKGSVGELIMLSINKFYFCRQNNHSHLFRYYKKKEIAVNNLNKGRLRVTKEKVVGKN